MAEDKEKKEKAAKPLAKPFLSVGPTLHYSHKNVQRCWLLALGAYGLTCLFWSKVLTGTFFSFDPARVTNYQFWRLGHFTISGASIFEYPWQILVLGLLMGVIGIAPVLISQLMSFRHSFLFAVAVFFLADLPAFAVCILVSCLAAACRPLRFRSRFIAIALCMAPQLLYWGFFGSVGGVEPIKWGFSFAPWLCAWLVGLAMAGFVLGIGHFTRYRPGLVWASTAGVLVLAVFVFEGKIGFDELDYQLYVARNDPQKVVEFHDHSLTDALDKTIMNEHVRKYLARYFYPTEDRIALRVKVKEKIQSELWFDRWPSWFIVPQELKYQQKKLWLLSQYDLFIAGRPKSNRMPIALYYRALLNEFSPDIRMVEKNEVLHFYSDYPFERSQEFWYQLYSGCADSAESIEARWRIAKHWAGQGEFELAEELVAEATSMVGEHLADLEAKKMPAETFFRVFRPPADSALTLFDLQELEARLNQLATLISDQNRSEKQESKDRLARFVKLNPHSLDYESALDELLAAMGKDDPLRDNVLLAKARLVADEKLRADRLAELHKDYMDSDAGADALYELCLLKISLWRQQSDANAELKRKYLADARDSLTSFLGLYPESFYAERVKTIVDSLPKAD